MSSHAPSGSPANLGDQDRGAARNKVWRSLAGWIAFYVSSVGLYALLRMTAHGHWPSPADLHLEWPAMAIGTSGLIVSSYTLHAAHRTAAKSTYLFTATLFMGLGFLVCQTLEYRSRWRDNLLPVPGMQRLYDRADLYYLSAVNRRLSEIATQINANKILQNQLAETLRESTDEAAHNKSLLQDRLQRLQADEPQRLAKLAIVNYLLASEARWTAFAVAGSGDLQTQRAAIKALADDIFPRQANRAEKVTYRLQEAEQLTRTAEELHRELAAAQHLSLSHTGTLRTLQRAVAELTGEIKHLRPQHDRGQFNANLQAEDDIDLIDRSTATVDPQQTEIRNRLAELESKFDVAQKRLSESARLVTESEDSASLISQEIARIRARQEAVAAIDAMPAGLNRQYPWLRLPVAIPGGNRWAVTYFLVTGAHIVQTVIGCIALSSSRYQRRAAQPTLTLPNRVAYWHFVSGIACVLFVLFYLL